MGLPNTLSRSFPEIQKKAGADSIIDGLYKLNQSLNIAPLPSFLPLEFLIADEKRPVTGHFLRYDLLKKFFLEFVNMCVHV